MSGLFVVSPPGTLTRFSRWQTIRIYSLKASYKNSNVLICMLIEFKSKKYPSCSSFKTAFFSFFLFFYIFSANLVWAQREEFQQKAFFLGLQTPSAIQRLQKYYFLALSYHCAAFCADQGHRRKFSTSFCLFMISAGISFQHMPLDFSLH